MALTICICAFTGAPSPAGRPWLGCPPQTAPVGASLTAAPVLQGYKESPDHIAADFKMTALLSLAFKSLDHK